MITTMETAIALNLPLDTDKDYLFDLQDAAINHLGSEQSKNPHPDPTIQALVDFLRKRQLVRIVRQKYIDGSVDLDKYYVYYEYRLDPETHRFERLLFDDGADNSFEWIYSGHGEFLHVKHPLNGVRYGQADPRHHFSNWDDFPELHSMRVFFFDCSDDDHGSPVSQDPSKYIL